MAALTVYEIDDSGDVTNRFVAAAAAQTFPNTDRTWFVTKNVSGGIITVTFTAQKTSVEVDSFGTLASGDETLAVPITTGEGRICLPISRFNNGSGQVEVGYSATADLTVAVFRLAKQ